MGKFWDTAKRVKEIMMRINKMVTKFAADPDYFFKDTLSVREKKNVKL